MEYEGKKRCFAGESAIWVQNPDPANIFGFDLSCAEAYRWISNEYSASTL